MSSNMIMKIQNYKQKVQKNLALFSSLFKEEEQIKDRSIGDR
jgi:hypothetical protein